MFAIDRRILARIEPVVRRVLIVDPNPHAARLLVETMKGMGAKDVLAETTEAGALKAAAALEPGIILTERTGPGLDGESLSKRIRRSDMGCRRAPIVMVTGEATAAAIIGARDSGVHEFLRKPYTNADVLKRIEAVASKPRDWIEAVGYVGPDRRRFNSAEYKGPSKRKSDRAASGAEALLQAKDQAMRILAAALNQFDDDPMQAVRAIKEQARALKQLGLKAADAKLVVAVGALEVSLASGGATKATLAAPIGGLLALHQIEPMKRAG